jgi:hypothetical protein
MRRLFIAALVSVVSMSFIFSASPVFAQDEEEPTPVPIVSSEFMEELDRLMKMLEEAEDANDQGLIAELQEQIREIEEEIRHAIRVPTETPVPVGESEEPQPGFQPPTAVDTSQGAVSSSPIDWCAELEGLKEKKIHYEALYALSDEELEARGYHQGKEEIGNTIRNLEEAIKRARLACEGGGVPSSGGGGGSGGGTTTTPVDVTPETVVMEKPIAVGSGGEITDYYRVRIAEIATEERAIEEKIAELKELRSEIDELIEELIKSKAEVSVEEVSGLVERIEVRPGEVCMDGVVVKTIDKSVVARIDNKNVAIKPTETQVIIRDGNLTVKTLGLSIENEALQVGDSEVNLRPGSIAGVIKIEPKEIELKEENAKAVYKIKADEDRKLFGFIPVKVEKTLTLDAANTEVKITEEERPWWTFLTTK